MLPVVVLSTVCDVDFWDKSEPIVHAKNGFRWELRRAVSFGAAKSRVLVSIESMNAAQMDLIRVCSIRGRWLAY
jgi:hypothetical protein